MSEEELKAFTLVPETYKQKDPRQLGYHYPKEIIKSERAFITYNKYVSQFIFYHSLSAAEQVVKTQGRILLPADCLNWRRASALADRRIFVGRKSFYCMQPSELRKSERIKLVNYLQSEGLM